MENKLTTEQRKILGDMQPLTPTSYVGFWHVWGLRMIYLTLFGCLSLQLWVFQRSVAHSMELSVSPVTLTELVPDKREYAPGDLVHFSYVRQVERIGTFPIILLGRDLFENVDTEEVFEAAVVTKVVRESGKTLSQATRRIPLNCPSGRYSLIGFIAVQSDKISKIQIYTSQPFLVAGTVDN